MNYGRFTKKQAEYIHRCADCWLNVCEGGKRAGKNVCNCIAFARAVDGHKDKIHLAGGVSIAAALMNVLDSNGLGLANYFRGRCRYGAYNGKRALIVKSKRAEKVIVFAGGAKVNDAALIKGNSYGCAYVSEINECHPSFFREVMDRTLASSQRKLFFDLNPKPPGHWFYREFLDYQDALRAEGENGGYNTAHFTIADNLSVADGTLREVLKAYDKKSPWFGAEILGKRIASGGRIYPNFSRAECAVGGKEISETRFEAFSVGVDIGGTDATAATLTGFTKNFKECWHLDGYYHKQGAARGYTHDRYAGEITERFVSWRDRFAGFDCPETYVFCESADKLFRQALTNEARKAGLNIRIVPAYKKDGILDRIRLIGILMNQGRYKISSHMEQWFGALEAACWREEALALGRWERVDNGSYPLDALDSAEYSVTPFRGRLI